MYMTDCDTLCALLAYAPPYLKTRRQGVGVVLKDAAQQRRRAGQFVLIVLLHVPRPVLVHDPHAFGRLCWWRRGG